MSRNHDAFELECLSLLESGRDLPDGCDEHQLMRDGLIADGDSGQLHLTDRGRARLAALRISVKSDSESSG